MKRIDIEKVIEIQRIRRNINEYSADEVTLYYKGHEILIDKLVTEDWKYTGLSLIDFIEMVVIPEYTPVMADLPIKLMTEEEKRKDHLDMKPETAVRIAKMAGILNEDGSLHDFYKEDLL